MIVRRIHPRFWTLALIGALFAFSASALAQSKGRPTTRRPAPEKTKPGATTAQSTQTDAEFDQIVKRADEARDATQLAEALELYGKALRMRPKWTEGWWYAGTILYDSDRYAEARDAFRNLVALDPKRAHGWGMLGLCEFQTREYDRAVVSLQRGRTLGLSDNREIESVVRYHTSLLYIRFEQFEVAFDILSEFMREGRESPKIIEAFGLTMMRLPFLPAEVPPDKRELILIAGRAGFDMAAHRKDEARRAFDELLKRFPETPNVHYAFGVYLLKQDSDAAMEEFRHELKLSPDHTPAMLQMAFEYLKRSEYETALPFAEKAVQIQPKLYPGRNVLGRLLLELGQTGRAITELEEGVRLAPNSPEMHYALARAYTRAGRKQDAARARETFQRLEKMYSAKRDGAQTDDGIGSGMENPAAKLKP